jgi:hypothetical protein
MKELGCSGIQVVLNSGSDMLESATIPVKWHFSEEIINADPQCVVIVDSDMSYESFKENGMLGASGHKYVHIFNKPSDLVGYVPVYRPGFHQFLVLVLCGDREKCMQEVENVRRRTFYYGQVERGRIKNSDSDVSQDAARIYAKSVAFEAPGELFARRPESGFQKMVWNWSNRWFDKEPIDQCEYRKRRIFAFTLQPILFAIGRLVGGMFWTAYGFTGIILLALVGLRPISPLKVLRRAWLPKKGERALKIREFEPPYKKPWHYWRVTQCDTSGNPIMRIPKFLVPIFIPFEAIALVGAYGMLLEGAAALSSMRFASGQDLAGWIAASAILFAILAFSTWRFLMSLRAKPHMTQQEKAQKEWERKVAKRDRRDEKIRKAEEELQSIEEGRRKKRASFLREHASLEGAPAKVEIGKIMQEVDVPAKFRLGFWAAKQKVCKPFAS